MAYLVTFHWGWLLASLLLGLGMGWIAVVHRGQGLSKAMPGLVAAVVAAAAGLAFAHLFRAAPATGSISGSSCLRSICVGCAVGSWLRRPGGLASRCGRIEPARAGSTAGGQAGTAVHA